MRKLLGKLMRPNPRKCEEARALMSDYVDGDLDTEGRKRLERHVRFCHRCHTVLANLRRTLARLRGLRETQPAGGDDPAAVAARVASGWREHTSSRYPGRAPSPPGRSRGYGPATGSR